MNASQAAKLADVAKHKLDKENTEKAAKAKAARIKCEIAARKKFLAEFREKCDSSIKFAVECGDHSTKIYIGESCHSNNQADEQFHKHKHLSIIERVMKQLQGDGYTVKQEIVCSAYETQHESTVPDYTYYLYYPVIKVSW